MSTAFTQIPILALVCYLVFKVALFPLRKQRLIRVFDALLSCFVLWTGGSTLMRLHAWPGHWLWYELSFLSLLCLPLALYQFVYEYVEARRPNERWLVIYLTIFLVVPAAFGLYLNAPIPERVGRGLIAFRYHADLRIIVPLLLVVCILILTIRLVPGHRRLQGFHLVLIGAGTLLLGNLLSILPGNEFPFDMLAGILNAGLLFWALYRRRLFTIQLLVTPSVIGLVTILSVCAVSAPVGCGYMRLLYKQLGPGRAQMALTIFFCSTAAASVISYQLLNGITRHFLVHQEKQRDMALEKFSNLIAHTPSRETLLQELLEVLRQMFGERPICVFLPDETRQTFQPIYPPGLQDTVAAIARTDPCAVWLGQQKGCLRTRQMGIMGVHATPDKVDLMHAHNITCIVPFREEGSLQGILFLGRNHGQHDYRDEDLVFLASLGSMASVGLKNAHLYQRLYTEARTDQLTGLLNCSAFTATLASHCEAGGPFALVRLDIDDFKLHNKLYGVKEGDRVLASVAALLRTSVEPNTPICRYGGKSFAALLPGADGLRGVEFARTIGAQMQRTTADKLYPITFSSAVCTFSGTEDPSQMLADLDMTIFQIKQTGKAQVRQCGAFGIDPAEALEKGYASIIKTITAAIDAKDHYTYSHSHNVAGYAKVLAKALGLDDTHVQMIYQAGLVHDVGKLAVPEHILSKPDRLSDEEYRIMQKHVERSVAIIRNLPSLDYVVPAAISHHERWDGKGYPMGLRGEEIEIGGRCLALADAFDAMTSCRAYKPAYTVEHALEQIRECAGTQFDPKLSAVFIQLVESGQIHTACDCVPA